MKTLLRGICNGAIITFSDRYVLFLLAAVVGLSIWQYSWISVTLLPFLASHPTYVLVPIVLFIVSAIGIGKFIEEVEDYHGIDPLFCFYAFFIGLVALVFYCWALASYVSITITVPS